MILGQRLRGGSVAELNSYISRGLVVHARSSQRVSFSQSESLRLKTTTLHLLGSSSAQPRPGSYTQQQSCGTLPRERDDQAVWHGLCVCVCDLCVWWGGGVW